ncbi:universal stress protein [Methanosarcina mazei]|jgi:nucleotide-binding universal stress UspA family protein|uniref:Universal stress protein n=6 Tax=Methanosarcina mazei TaxID=2209 RepID=A0A0F8H5S8_METMZ|nr:universal stress protein [Methanosarcina mazei]AAM31150.1 Universal stress protein [Methanosarcina mazei Go1]AKB42198.1 Universal stress protein [Methanosarcina mazei WWM610]AKB63062.1 Universal stress protein [Methanosarcina mazei SarPi]AKB69753.1 Universal stress protein [Methanosarcina mazei LYC]AKB73122.1 Universal stress protein [Methanosarcina mazei C16]
MEENIGSKPQKKILIATDGSETANEAADFGIGMVGCTGAKVYALYVIDTSPYRSVSLDKIWSDEVLAEHEKEGRESTAYIERIGKAAGVEVECKVLKGNPADKIITFAEDNDMDMIIVGSLGKGGYERFVLGSVSEKIVRHSKIPVLVVREKHKSEKRLMQE